MTRKNLLILSFVSFVFNVSHSQQALPYDVNKVSKNRELNFAGTDKRGIEVEKGVVYCVEKDLKILTTYEDGKLKWKADIIGICGEPAVGRPEIRYIRLDNDKIYVVFGKHSFAYVYRSDGKIDYLGAD